MVDISNEVFSGFSFVGFLLVSIPFYWHAQAWNAGTCLYMGWTAMQCLNAFINSVVWNNNAINWAPVFCDISSKLSVGAGVGLPAASLCINRRLYIISSIQSVTNTRAQKLRAVYIDLAIGLGLPIIAMALHYVVQGHRFDIYEEFGCSAEVYNTPVAFVLVYCWPLVISCVSAVYCALTIRAFAKQTVQFRKLLSSSLPNVTMGRYFRLMALAGTEAFFGIPLSCYVIYFDGVLNPIYPWLGWADTHYNFSRVDLIPKVIWSLDTTAARSSEVIRWFPVVCAFLFFALFGFTVEAKKVYTSVFWVVARRFGFKPKTNVNTGYGSSGSDGIQVHISVMKNGSIPSFVSPGRRAQPGRKSIDTISSERLDSVIVIEPPTTDASLIQSSRQSERTSQADVDSHSVHSLDSHGMLAPPGITLQSPPPLSLAEETHPRYTSHLNPFTPPENCLPAHPELCIPAVPRRHSYLQAPVEQSPGFGALDIV
ncbi:hypothetical protein JAAARDRAFT_199631 [Jaapia argillacea MUCL 33604]|uniref:Uncharacterized protein n=1 Tax=Jaapia argillacea MUCL 33604 TaxID=933084 RepID=A0A067PK12_9AGAM|nr:hypothetical protein JAAARDRAFT_199631 [Jaapia argillacea MUCL 33604]